MNTGAQLLRRQARNAEAGLGWRESCGFPHPHLLRLPLVKDQVPCCPMVVWGADILGERNPPEPAKVPLVTDIDVHKRHKREDGTLGVSVCFYLHLP